MHDHPVNPEEERRHLEAAERQGYELRDVNVKPIGRAGVMFLVFTVVSFVAAFGMMWFWVSFSGRDVRSYIKTVDERPEFVGPRLQTNISNTEDIKKLRESEFQRLGSVGWADDTQTKVRIPIEEAMEKVAAEGLAPKPAPATAPQGTAIP